MATSTIISTRRAASTGTQIQPFPASIAIDLLQVDGVVGAVDVRVQGHLIWSQPQAEHVGPMLIRPLEREVVNRLEVDGNLTRCNVRRLRSP
jgi:hypothetical protein